MRTSANNAPGRRSNLSVRQQRDGRYEVERNNELRRFDLNLLRQQISARSTTFQLAAPRVGLLLAVMMMMLAAICGFRSNRRRAVLDAAMRVVPAASKHRMDE